ncbi:MAG: hypothetical protein A4E57_04070 [Syntrophorhabdaceae bacterium PtaU1.Bin034]|jgi:hypothetical protein|nr:MAG: hypothetical protein A4E57_04070 [Syntrophorhabdaceae bacterium PtaU1.Bin034]
MTKKTKSLDVERTKNLSGERKTSAISKKNFPPAFNEFDFINLPNRYIYLKLMIGEITSKPFSATTLPPQSVMADFKDRAIEA